MPLWKIIIITVSIVIALIGAAMVGYAEAEMADCRDTGIRIRKTIKRTCIIGCIMSVIGLVAVTIFIFV